MLLYQRSSQAWGRRTRNLDSSKPLCTTHKALRHPRPTWDRGGVCDVHRCQTTGRQMLLQASARPSATAGQYAGREPTQADNAVNRLYDAINHRDVAQVAACFAADVEYQNLAFLDSFSGATAVARFYQDSLAALPEGAQLVLEQHAGAGDTSAGNMAVVWRLMLADNQTTVSRGVAFFTLNASGRISSILDSPEHAVKITTRGLTVFGPLVQGLADSMLPAVQELSRAVQQGVDMLFQPLEGLITPSGGDATPGASSWATNSNSGSGPLSPGDNSSSTNANSSTPAWSSTGRPPVISTNPYSSSPASSRQPAGPVSSAGLTGSWANPVSAAPALPRPVPAAGSAGSPGSGPQGTVPPSAMPAGNVGTPASRRLPVAAAATTGGPEGVGVDQQGPPNFSGLWVKVPERSDRAGYEATLDVLGLSGLQKVTARLIDGLDIQQSSTRFTVNFVTVVPFFRVTEDVPLDGGSTQLGRRDLRFGRQATAASSVEGGVLVDMSWGPPLAGSLTESYSLMEDGCLCVEANTRVGDKSATSKTVYRRSTGSREQLLSESKKRNPSVAAVLQQQKQQGLDV